MSLEHNNFRSTLTPPQPAASLHGGTSLIKTINQKISFTSIYKTFCNRLGSCLCLHPERHSGPGWIFVIVLSAVLSVLLCILLLPLKLILIGLSCCPCVSKPTTLSNENILIPSSAYQPPPSPLNRRSSFSRTSVELDPSRFSPSSLTPPPRQEDPPLRPTYSTQTSIPSQPSFPPERILHQEITLQEHLQINYPGINPEDITLENLGITCLDLEDLPQGTSILDLPASMFFQEEIPNLVQQPTFLSQQDVPWIPPSSLPVISSHEPLQPHTIHQPTPTSSQTEVQTTSQDQSVVSQPSSLSMDISANTATGRDIDQNLTAREFLNAAYPNADQQIALINGARVNATLLGISLGESDDDVLNLPAAVVFPDLMLGPIARPTSLDLDTSHSLDHHAEILPNIPDEEPISPSDPRYMFLQNNFPEVEPEHYSRHIELLASLAGIEAENFDLLQLPMNAFVPTPAPQPDYQPLSLEEAQERFSDISPEAYADQNNAFIRNLIENSPKRWDFVNRLRNNITSITPSLSLRREWFTILDVIVKKSDPDLEGKETQDLARAYLFKIYSILKNSDVSQERKLELLKYVASYKNSPAHLWLEAMQQELALQKEIDPKTMAFHTEEGACAAGVSGISSRRILLPTLKSKPSTKEFNDYIKLLKNLLSRPVCTEMDNIHLAPTNDEYLESLTRNSPKTWKPIREPLEKRIKELTPNSSIHNAWSRILLVLSTARDRLMSSQEAQALSQSTMYQLLQLLNNPKIPQDKKLSILSNIASYSNRCAPTWVRTTGQELQAIFNANDVSTNIVFSWVQIFKEHLLAQICRDEREWHIMTAFKHQYGAELGLDNTGVFLDTYTRTLASDRYRTKHENYLQEFLNAYETSGEGLVNSALSQALGGSQDQILALRDIILADLTAIGIPEEYRADIMTEVFFPEDNNYNPSREAILYLLLKEGVITAQDRSSTP